MAIPENNDRINAIALTLERQALTTLVDSAADKTPNSKGVGVDLRGFVVEALALGGAEPLAGMLLQHVTYLAIILDPKNPTRVIDKLERATMSTGDGVMELDDALVPISLLERATATAERLKAELDKARARIARLEKGD